MAVAYSTLYVMSPGNNDLGVHLIILFQPLLLISRSYVGDEIDIRTNYMDESLKSYHYSSLRNLH